MKRKLFLVALMIAVLTCLFAISVSAATMFTSSYTTELTTFGDSKPEWANLEDTNATAVLKKTDGTYVRVPAYYIFKVNGNQFKVDGSNFDYGWVSEQLKETEILTNANLVAIDVPQGTTSFSGTLSKTVFSALEEMVIPTTVTGLPQKFLRDNTVIKKVFVKQSRNADGSINGVTAIPDFFADMNTSGCVSSLEVFDFELNYVTSIGANAFMKSALKSFYVEAPITTIKGAIFNNCAALTTVYINNTGDTIDMGSQAFRSATALTSVTLNGFNLTNYLFEDANGLTGGLTVKATNVNTLGTMPFKNSTNLEHVEISGAITNFGSNTFLGCHNLSTVKVTNTLNTPATCESKTFDGLKGLTSVEMHGISIPAYAFRQAGQSTLKINITNAGFIGEQAFYKTNAVEIYISGPFSSIGNSTYRECPNLKKLTVVNTGDTYVTAGNGESNTVLEELRLEGKINITGTPAFQNNYTLKHVYIGDGVQTLGTYAFYKCYSLETMYLADSVVTIDDRAIDMDGKGNQRSTSFMFVDENGNMDNTLPTSLETIGGHFLKWINIANTELIFPEGFTNHSSEQAYDFEGTTYPNGFRLIYLGKMTKINLHKFYQHNESKDIAVYLTKNSPSDIKNYRVNVNIAENGALSHGTYAGVNENGTLEIVLDDRLHNNIDATKYIKFIFCGTQEVCFVTRVNIVWETNTSSNWGNFVSMPVTYAQLETAYNLYNTANPDAKATLPANHPILSAPEYSDATCTEDGGIKTFCLGCGQVASIEKTEDAKGHNFDYVNGNATLVSYVYENYLANGTKTVACANCQEHKEFDIPALFACQGYSVCQDGTIGFAIGYRVDVGAIDEYQNVTGKTVKYGLYAAAMSKLDGNDILDENGDPTDGSIKAEISDTDFVAFELKITGFAADQKDAKVAIGAYVAVTNGEETKYAYLQGTAPGVGEKYAFVSYNDVLALTA